MLVSKKACHVTLICTLPTPAMLTAISLCGSSVTQSGTETPRKIDNHTQSKNGIT